MRAAEALQRLDNRYEIPGGERAKRVATNVEESLSRRKSTAAL
jgi:hypothetical protein